MSELLKTYIKNNNLLGVKSNLLITTQRIKELYADATNSKIFDELIMLENAGIIRIKQVARARKIYKDRNNWLQWKQRICRYSIDILKPEYFEMSNVSKNDWAIKAYVDTQNWNFVLQFNGIDEFININLKPAKGAAKTKTMNFWEQAQNHPNDWCETLFARAHTSMDSFFGRFCKELRPFFIEFEKGGYRARFIPVIYPDVLKSKSTYDFVLFKESDHRLHLECKFDENGKFLGWHKC